MHTPNIAPLMELLPFLHMDGGVTKKIMVLPDESAADRVDENGILIPAGAGVTIQHGTVVAVCPDSYMLAGDRVSYMPINRMDAMDPLEVVIDGVRYHHILESEVWDVNDFPVNRLYIIPRSGIEVNEDGISGPNDAHNLLQYGKVFRAPLVSEFNEGDVVGYRRPENAAFPTANVDGQECEIIFERDVLTVNCVVSPHRIIVKIDTLAQRRHQSANENNILLHPNFIHMTRNLQYAMVHGIGSEAEKMYPGIKAGDYVAIHHTIEHQSNRIVGVRRANNGTPIADFRALHCQRASDNEIFAKLFVHKSRTTPGKMKIEDIEPYGDLHFFEWGFDVLSPHKETLSDESIQMPREEFNVSNFKDLERLRLYIDGLKRQATDTYKATYAQYVAKLQRLNPEIQEQKNERDHYESKIEEMKRSADAIGKKLGQNFVVACKIVAPKEYGYSHIVTTYKELYPLQILGKRYLIGYKQFIIGFLKSKNDMDQLTNFVPFGSRVLVKALEEKEQSEILIPKELIQERPERGTVISVGDGGGIPMLAKPGDTVWFRKGSGVPIKLGGKDYLVFRQNEDLMGFEAAAQ